MWFNTSNKQIVTRSSPTRMMNTYGGDWRHPFASPPAPWVYNPDLSAVVGLDKKHWKVTYTPSIVGTIETDTGTGIETIVSFTSPATATIEAMTLPERDAVDAAELADSREAVASQLDQTEDVLRAFMLLVLDQINELRADHGRSAFTAEQLRNAIKNKLGS